MTAHVVAEFEGPPGFYSQAVAIPADGRIVATIFARHGEGHGKFKFSSDGYRFSDWVPVRPTHATFQILGGSPGCVVVGRLTVEINDPPEAPTQ